MRSNHQRVVLVTGASSGIGRACALHLARKGFQVVGTTRGDAGAIQRQLCEELGADDSLEMVTLDVDRETSVREAIHALVSRLGRIDAVINCAGFGIAGSIEDTSDAEARALLETNLLGTVRVCRAVLPTMRAQRSGTLVILSSIGGRIGLPFQGWYSATKFALEGLTEALRMELRSHGVKAVLVEPGDFSTGFTDSRVFVERSKRDCAYRSAQEHVMSIVEKDERGGASPEAIATLVGRILRAKSPRVRYTVGPAAQKLAAALKNVLPSKWFEWVLSMYYGVK